MSLQEVEKKCPDGCHCYIININDPLWVKVNCAELNLTKLPDSLPPNTQVLNVSYNMVGILLCSSIQSLLSLLSSRQQSQVFI